MLITCPNCAAEYNVPGALAPGRVVRCARCASEWAPTRPLAPPVVAPVIEARPIEAPVMEAPVAPVVEAPSMAPVAMPKPTKLAAPAVRAPPGRLALPLAWGGSVALLAVVAAAAVVWREPVMQAWPPSIRVYDALRLTAHP